MNKPGDRCQISRVGGIVRAGLVFLLSVVAVSCGAVGTYRAYSVDYLPACSVTALEGSQYLHQEWLNRDVDVMRFAQVDRKVIVNIAEHEPIEIKSGSHETAVYFCWGMDRERSLTPAWSVTRLPESLCRGLFASRP